MWSALRVGFDAPTGDRTSFTLVTCKLETRMGIGAEQLRHARLAVGAAALLTLLWPDLALGQVTPEILWMTV